MRDARDEQQAENQRSPLRSQLENAYASSVQQMREHKAFIRLQRGEAARGEYDALIVKVCETHLLSAHFVAFAYSLAPPAAANSFAHNLLEELGTAGEVAHSALLVQLLEGAGLAHLEAPARREALLRLRDRVMEPVFYGSLREVGFAALVEIVGFEFMLSRVASEIAGFLREHRGIADSALEWFTHHSEVDVGHAEQGLDALVQYAEYYEFESQDALDIVNTALEENIYLKRYFGAQAAADATLAAGGGSTYAEGKPRSI